MYDESIRYLNSLNIVFNASDVCKIVAQKPAPKFYVSLEEALYQYRLYTKGKSNIRRVERRKMYAEIFYKYEELMRQSQGKAHQYSIMSAVLEQPAASFYLADPVSFYYRALRKKLKKGKDK